MTDREQDREQSEFEAWCKRDCSPGAHTSEWYSRIWHESWQAATSAAAERIAQLTRERDEAIKAEQAACDRIEQLNKMVGSQHTTLIALREQIAQLTRERDEARAEVDELSGRGKKRDLKPGDYFWAKVRYGGKMKPKIYLDDEAIDAAMQENDS